MWIFCKIKTEIYEGETLGFFISVYNIPDLKHIDLTFHSIYMIDKTTVYYITPHEISGHLHNILQNFIS